MAGQDTRIGTQLGKYRLVHRLGEGGMGVVYVAEDPILARRVALKILAGEALRAPGAAQRFVLEARAAARLNHPNVVTVYDFGQQDDVSYIAMELVEGASVQEVLRERGALPWPQATRIIADICRGLVAAHAAGFIHRDIKPANILLGGDGSVKLTDFGLAKAPQLVPAHDTHRGTILGTPHYMSPEQCAGERLDNRADLYALGAAYHALLTGRPPYDGSDSVKVMYAHCAAPVPDPRSLVPALPEVCAAIVRKALAKKRADRYRSAQEMLTALTAVLAPLPTDLVHPVVAAPAPAPPVTENTEIVQPLVLTTQPQVARRPRRRFALPGSVLALVTVLAISLIVAIAFFNPRSEEPVVQPKIDNPLFPDGKPITLGQRRKLGEHFKDEARGLTFGGRRFASVGADKRALVWDLDRPQAPPKIFNHPHQLDCVALSPDGQWLATAKNDTHFVSLWDVDAEKELGNIPEAHHPWSLAFHPSAKRLAIGSNPLLLIDLNAAGKEIKRQRFAEHCYVVKGVAFTADGRRLGAATFGPGAFWLDGATLEKIKFVASPVDLVAGLALSVDGKRMAFAKKFKDSQDLFLWEPETERPPQLVTKETGSAVISAVAFAPGGRQIAHGGTHAGPVKLHDLKSGQASVFATDVNGNLTGLAFSPDGRLLAATFSEGSVLVWDVVPARR